MGLRYLDGGGDGCTYPDAQPSFARRTFHHLTFYGFLLCFAATTRRDDLPLRLRLEGAVSALQPAGDPGHVGGIGLIVGPVGLLWLSGRRDPELVDAHQDGMDLGFLVAAASLTSADGPAAALRCARRA